MNPMPRSYEPPDGFVVQAFSFALDPTNDQATTITRFFGARRKSYNWALEQVKAGIDVHNATGEKSDPPSLYGLRKRWNAEKSSLCIDRDTGEIWWPQVSKEVFADGIKGAVDGYWRWQKSRAGKLAGRRVGFPRFQKRGKDRGRFTFTTGSMRFEHDRRHLTLPVLGTVRTHENTRRIERLCSSGQAKVLSITISRRGHRFIAAVKVAVARPQQSGVLQPPSVVGVDVGVRRLATVATPTEVIAVFENPEVLEHRLAELRRLNRQRSRRARGSSRYRETAGKITRLHTEVGNVRKHAIHTFTTNLAKTHGTIVVEGLDAAGMLRQKGLPGARARRRGLSDAAIGEIRRQLRYKCAWYGATLIEADRYFPSSKTCHCCRHIQVIGWSEHWSCENCGVTHQRDDNAAINLARWASLGSVGAPVKRGAEHQTGPRSAVGDDPRKGGPAPVGPNNSVRSAA
ncbi:MAG: IS607 family element RNA-guided endonuclease TnpB [Acidimicrobiales bacterium]